MWSVLFLFISCGLFQYSYGFSSQDNLMCVNHTHPNRSCTTQILGKHRTDYNACKIENVSCWEMDFGMLQTNRYIGGVSLRPYSFLHDDLKANMTALNITFTNIKWKSMKFRFQPVTNRTKNYCRKIEISNDVVPDDRSVLYYDCYWAHSRENKQSYFDFEATTGDSVVNRGQYYFNIPSADMLSDTVTETEWIPFIYVEMPTILHIVPPPSHLKITGYEVKVMKVCDHGPQCREVVKNDTLKLKNNTEEVTYEYNIELGRETGLYYFVVIPLHENCGNGRKNCTIVKSPQIKISNDQTLNICIASITALVVATLFTYYIVLRVIRRYWCKDYSLATDNDIPAPTKVLVIYSTANRLHAECVASFVTYLRTEYGFEVMYDGDITNTATSDPYVWAEKSFELASHVMYIVGPAEDTNIYNSIYDKPIISPHKNVDLLLLSFLRASRISRCPKEVLNVFFEHSNGQVPIETRHDKVFFLLKDWQKLIAYLSKNLIPRQHIMRTERGRSFLEDLSRARKLLGVKKGDVVKCDKVNFIEKKMLV